MAAVLLVAWLSAADTWEDTVFPVVDGLERLLTPKAQQFLVVGIFVVGNDRTDDSEILDRLPLYSGGRLYYWRMRLAELRLARSGLFEVDLRRRLWPRVTAFDPFEDSDIRDIKVEVVEKRQTPP